MERVIGPRPPRRATGVTLAELAVVMVILAVTALVGIPLGLRVVESAAGESAAASLAAIGHDALTMAARAQTPVTSTDLVTAAAEVTPQRTVLVSSDAAPVASTGPDAVSADTTDGTAASPPAVGLAAVTSFGGCAMALLSGYDVTTWWTVAHLGAGCNGDVALSGPPTGAGGPGGSTTTTSIPGGSTTTTTSAPSTPSTPSPIVTDDVLAGSGATLAWDWTASTGGSGPLTYYWSVFPTAPGCASGSTTGLTVTCAGVMAPSTDYAFSIYAQDPLGDTSGLGTVDATTPTPSTTTTTAPTTTTTAPTTTTTAPTTTTTAPTTTTTAPTTTTTGATGSAAFPLYLLGDPTCAGAALTETGAAQVVSDGGQGPIGLTSPCASSVHLDGSAALNASSIYTGDTGLAAYCFTSKNNQACLASDPGPPEHYLANRSNPFAGLVPPVDPSGGSTVSCTPDYAALTCPAGTYATSPTLNAHASGGVTFATGTTVFDAPVSVTNNAVVHFAGGTYWFKDGLSMTGEAVVTFGPGTYIFGSGSGSGCYDSTCLSVSNGASVTTTSPSGSLFYVAAGKATIDGDGQISLTGSSAYDGIALWDAAASGTSDPLTIANSGSLSDVLGGVYAPNGAVVLTGAGTTSAAFVEASTATLSNSGSLVIGS